MSKYLEVIEVEYEDHDDGWTDRGSVYATRSYWSSTRENEEEPKPDFGSWSIRDIHVSDYNVDRYIELLQKIKASYAADASFADGEHHSGSVSLTGQGGVE